MNKVLVSVVRCIFPILTFFSGASTPVWATPYLWQTNSFGNDIHIYDLDNYQLVRRLEVGANPHGIAAPENNHVVYVSLERYRQAHGELLWINPSNLEIERRLEVCQGAQNIATTPDGRWIYVPCKKDGRYWVIDAESGNTVGKIETGGRPHNARASSDGRRMYLSPLGAPNAVTVVDVMAGHQVKGVIPFGGQVRPLFLSADGQWLFQQVDGVNGFKVADTSQLKVVSTVGHEASLEWYRPIQDFINRVSTRLGYGKLYKLSHCHGLGIRPDETEIWATCGNNLNIHSLDSDGYSGIAHLSLPGTGYWLSFSPDSRLAAVALADRGQTVIVDANDKKILRVLAVGHSPRRNIVIDY